MNVLTKPKIKKELTLDEIKKILVNLYASQDPPIQIVWDEYDEAKGYIPCPAIHLHTGGAEATKLKDTAVMIDMEKRKVWINCFHGQGGCSDVVRKINQNLKRMLASSYEFKQVPKTAEEKKTSSRLHHLSRVAKQLEAQRMDIINRFPWPVEAIVADSAPIKNAWQQYLSLWNEKDNIWCGDKFDSGEPKFAGHWNPVENWRAIDFAPCPFISSSTYPLGNFKRQNKFYDEQKFMVVEADDLHPDPKINKDLSGGLIRWLVEDKGWDLKMVLDSGNKSIHAHFTYDAEQHEWAGVCLPKMGVDHAPLNPTQPVRSPNYLRQDTGKEQTLLWIA